VASAAFNRVLDQRIDSGRVTELVDGDLAWKHDSRKVFPVTEALLAEGALADRLARLEISPSGPLWGRGFRMADGAVGETEREALAATGVDQEAITVARDSPEGGRRPLRTPIAHVDVEGGADEHGSYIRVAFDLARGMYATITLREIMKND
jgi:tRNA pseudouridine13 synthase